MHVERDRYALAAVVCGAHRDRSGTGAYDEPPRVAAQAPPEGATFCGSDGGVAFAGESCHFCGVVHGILFCGGELGLAGAAIPDVIEEGFEVGGGNLRGGSVTQVSSSCFRSERGGLESE
jgi:hypothetical protein